VRLNLKILASDGGRRPRAKLGKATSPTHVSPDMSFLEMLDVVNEGLRQGRQGTPSPSTRELPRRHLRHCAASSSKRSPRTGPDPRHHRLPAPHAEVSRTADTITVRNRWRGERPSPSSRISSSTGGAFDRMNRRRAATWSVNCGRRPGRQTRFPFRRRSRIFFAMDSAAWHRLRRVAWRPARKRIGASLHERQDLAISRLLPQGAGSSARPARRRDDRSGRTRKGFGSCSKRRANAKR